MYHTPYLKSKGRGGLWGEGGTEEMKHRVGFCSKVGMFCILAVLFSLYFSLNNWQNVPEKA